jgi:protein tyrosine/serine phosphatase
VITRDLVWEGCLNVRDLGGLPTEDGGMTRFGAVVRADNVRKLTEEGWRALDEYGVATIVDLRLAQELAEDPLREFDAKVVHVPVFDGDAAFWAAVDQRLSHLDAVAHKREEYLAALEHWPHRFGEAFAAVANAREGIVVVHCAGGKDRTGLVSALLLRQAGVGLDEIAADYALAEERLAELRAAYVAAATDDADRELRTRLAAAPAAAMRGVLEAIERRHGSVGGFLREAGVDDDTLARGRARLRNGA